MAEHERLAQRLVIRVFVVPPHDAAQSGCMENANGSLRQYLPKTTYLSGYTQHWLNARAHQLRTHRCKCLGFVTSLEVDAQLRHCSPIALEA